MFKGARVVLLLLVVMLFMQHVASTEPEQFHMLKTIVDDANCTVEDIDEANSKYFYPIVSQLVNHTFFKIFKVDLSSDCPFWAMKVMCGVEGGCSVCRCDEKDIPIPWKVSKKDRVNTFLAMGTQRQKWVDNSQHLWFPKQHEEKMTYVNLALNPETNTGYSGSEANRVWKAVYTENCFKAGKLQDMCLEERVFFRLLSGLHTSITMKIATYFHKRPPIPTEKPEKVEYNSYDMFSPNLEFFEHRIAPFTDRLRNLYFLYAFTLRAIQKAAKHLSDFDYTTGHEADDEATRQIMKQLVSVNETSCNPTFDETMLFKSMEKTVLHTQMRDKFRNISMIMDCVACEKCKMWAKLEMLGLATAFKIVLDESDASLKNLQRNEIIALINSFKQHAQAIKDLSRLKTMVWRKNAAPYITYAISASVVLAVVHILISVLRSGGNKGKQE